MAGGIITTGNHPKALWPGIWAWWGRQYNEHVVEHTDLFDQATSTQSYEELVEVTGFGLAPVKPEGLGISYDSETQGTLTRSTHVAYALGYIVTYEERQDNLYEVVSKRRSQALAFSMRQTEENVAGNVYNRAFDSNFTFGDGTEMIASTHTTVDGTQSNILSPAADISEAAIEDLVIQIYGATNSKGLKFNLVPQCVVIPRQLWYETNRILGSVLQNDTANNAINVLKAVSEFPKGIKMNHYLTDSDAWFIRTNCPQGLIRFSREAISFDQDNDYGTKNALAACYQRYSFTIADFRSIYGSPGA